MTPAAGVKLDSVYMPATKAIALALMVAAAVWAAPEYFMTKAAADEIHDGIARARQEAYYEVKIDVGQARTKYLQDQGLDDAGRRADYDEARALITHMKKRLQELRAGRGTP